MHVCCPSQDTTYSHDMLMKCMFMANNGVIVLHLLLYTRKGEGKDANSLPLVSLFSMGLMLKVIRESICAHKDSFLIPKYQGH